MIHDQTDEERITYAYRLVLSRNPGESESKILLKSLNRLRLQYQSDPAAVSKILSAGESPRDPSLNKLDHAAYTGLCLAILNLDEALCKE